MKLLELGNHLTPYLLGATVLLAGTLALESRNLVEPERDGEGTGEAGQPVSAVQHTAYQPPAIAAFSEITERPLFTEGREPPAEPEAAPVVAATSPLRLQLEGVAISPDAKIAVLRDLSNNQMLHLAKGMKHQGWELTAISDADATFTRGGQNLELKLLKDQ